MGAYFQSSEHEVVVVDPAPGCPERSARAGTDPNVVWRLRRQLLGKTIGRAELVGTLGGDSGGQPGLSGGNPRSCDGITYG